MTDASFYDVTPASPPGTGALVSRALRSIASDRVTLENFGCPGDGSVDDFANITTALTWSATNRRPVYAAHTYKLGQTLIFPAYAALISGPRARFIRDFGNEDAGSGELLIATPEDSDAPEILIDGGT